MRRRGYAEEYLLWLLLFDLAAIAAGLFLSYLLRFYAPVIPSGDGWRTIIPITKGWNPADYVRIWPIAIGCWAFGLSQARAYRAGAPVFDLEVVRRLCVGSLTAIALVLACVFFFRVGEYSRPMAIIAVVCVVFALIVERWLFAHVLRAATPRQMDPVLILGSATVAQRLAHTIQAQSHHGMTLVGFLTDNLEEVGTRVDGIEPVEGVEPATYIGSLDDLDDILRETKARQLIIARPDLSSERIADLMLHCERQIVECRIVPDLLGAIVSERNVRNVGGVLLCGMRVSPLQGWNVVFKRVFDFVLSVMLLTILSPFLLLIAIIVRLDSPGGVLYKQQRMGLDGRKFNLYKFRSMRTDAETKDAPGWTTADDDRKTRIGGFLRKYNIDEFPQLFNVLRGDMSLVGPRPERPHFVKQFRDEIPHYMARHRAKCGMTGWAQVNGLRGDSSIADRIAYDLYYIENWSLWLDVKILLLTFGAIKNAY